MCLWFCAHKSDLHTNQNQIQQRNSEERTMPRWNSSYCFKDLMELRSIPIAYSQFQILNSFLKNSIVFCLGVYMSDTPFVKPIY